VAPSRSTIYTVARQSGVSTATVSRVMRNGSGFSEATRERVLSTVAEMDWVPSGAARGLATQRTGIVGLLFPDIGLGDDDDEESPRYIDEVIRGAERAATEAGDAVLIAATRHTSGRELAFSVASKVDGLVVLSGSLSEHDLTSIARQIPVVVLANTHITHRLDSVGTDNESGMHDLTCHLIDAHGYTDLAYVGGPPDCPDDDERFAGFQAALTKSGLPVPDCPEVAGAFTRPGGEQAMQTLLDDRPTPPRAVVCGNDEMAIGALATLRANGLRVPGDVAVTGFDDIVPARHHRPGLTTVRQPMRQLGERSIELLLARVDDPRGKRSSLVLPTQVVVRGSCGCRRRAAGATTAGHR
jgi:LacI family transcriptional regulator, galactose operon repressor